MGETLTVWTRGSGDAGGSGVVWKMSAAVKALQPLTMMRDGLQRIEVEDKEDKSIKGDDGVYRRKC